jgi:TolA-binding protein
MIDDDDKREAFREGWHLDKRINLAHLLTTLSIVGAVFAWGSTVEKRQAILETRQDAAEKVSNADRSAIRDLRDEIRETNRKLDRLIETWSKR